MKPATEPATGSKEVWESVYAQSLRFLRESGWDTNELRWAATVLDHTEYEFHKDVASDLGNAKEHPETKPERFDISKERWEELVAQAQEDNDVSPSIATVAGYYGLDPHNVKVHIHLDFGDECEDYIAPIPPGNVTDPEYIGSRLPIGLQEKLRGAEEAYADVPADSTDSEHVSLR